MNRVLILAGGLEAKQFLKNVITNYINVAQYDIVYKKNSDIDKSLKIDGVKFYNMDFSYYIKLDFFKKQDYSKIIVMIRNRTEALNVYKILSDLNKNIPIEFIKFWDVKLDSIPSINVVDAVELLVYKVVDLLPNVPLYARNIGLGHGEIMEIQVPFSSPYVYRSISNIQNKNYRVAGIYRNDKLILPKRNSIILPNDTLVIFGKPNILKDLFKSIKEEKGTFPAPFGNNIYLLIDMLNMNKKLVSRLLKTAIHLHRKIENRKLIIKIINPTIENRLNKLRKFENIDIYFDYYDSNIPKILSNDIHIFNVGIIIIDNRIFYNFYKELYELKKPILKIGSESIKKCMDSIILLENDKNFEQISPVIFDLSSQLKLKINFTDIDPEESNKGDVIKYFKNLSQIYYYKNVDFITSTENPVKKLKELNVSCMFIPFNKSLPMNRYKALLFPTITNSFLFLDKMNQFFIPTTISSQRRNNED